MNGAPSTKNARRGWYWLLVIPCVAPLWVGSYAKADPALFGLPFFYWYQLLWVVLCALITGIVYRLSR